MNDVTPATAKTLRVGDARCHDAARRRRDAYFWEERELAIDLIQAIRAREPGAFETTYAAPREDQLALFPGSAAAPG